LNAIGLADGGPPHLEHLKGKDKDCNAEYVFSKVSPCWLTWFSMDGVSWDESFTEINGEALGNKSMIRVLISCLKKVHITKI
jgi:hypothetical protein